MKVRKVNLLQCSENGEENRNRDEKDKKHQKKREIVSCGYRRYYIVNVLRELYSRVHCVKFAERVDIEER